MNCHLEYRNIDNGDLKSETHNETELHNCIGCRVSVSIIIGTVIKRAAPGPEQAAFPYWGALEQDTGAAVWTYKQHFTKIVQDYNIITFCLICETGDLVSDYETNLNTIRFDYIKVKYKIMNSLTVW